MKENVAWYHWISLLFKEFITEAKLKPQYKIVNLYKCEQTGFMKAVIKLSERHVIQKNISDIIVDNDFLEGFDKTTIRTLTYMATLEYLKPEYSITVQKMTDKVDDYILEIQSKSSNIKLNKSPFEISQDKNLIAKFDPIEANRIGYLAGVRETVKEYQLIQK